MVRLENSRFIYHNDLSELYLICNECVFEDMIELIRKKIEGKMLRFNILVRIIHKIKNLILYF